MGKVMQSLKKAALVAGLALALWLALAALAAGLGFLAYYAPVLMGWLGGGLLGWLIRGQFSAGDEDE